MVPGHETHGNLALLQAKESAGDVFDLTPPDYWFPVTGTEPRITHQKGRGYWGLTQTSWLLLS